MNDGIPYFPFDVHLDDKFELIEAEFGLVGFAVVVKLLQRIYGGAGYFCEWTPDVTLLFCKSSAVDASCVDEIVKAALRRGIFDIDLFERYHVLTSKGIQKRYFSAVSRRKELELQREYLLIDAEAICRNVNIHYKNDDKTSQYVDSGQQRKEKERKGYKTREKKASAKAGGASSTEETEGYGFSGKLEEAVTRWICYKKERGEAYKQTGLRSLLGTIRKKETEYGGSVVAELIDECMSNNWKGIIWDRLGRREQVQTGSYDYDEIERGMWDRIKEGQSDGETG